MAPEIILDQHVRISVIIRLLHKSSFWHLASYAQGHNSNYLRSLWVYLDCQQNLLAAAEQLKIHRNTLTIRLTRIADIGGIDLTDNEAIFQLLLSRRIVRYHG